MIDNAQGVNEGLSASEEIRPEVIAFKESIAKVDGTLIPLLKPTKEGKKLFISARQIQNPWEFHKVFPEPGYHDFERKMKEGADKNANPDFFGWQEDLLREGEPDMTSVMLVDVYAQSRGKIIPLGHMDWYLQNDCANGGGNMHEAPIPKEKHEIEASRRWHPHDPTAFKVDYNYHRQGLGSLMLATSGIALSALGAKNFFPGALIEPARKTYQRFNLKDADFQIKDAPLKDWKLPIEKLSQNPQVNKTINEFV